MKRAGPGWAHCAEFRLMLSYEPLPIANAGVEQIGRTAEYNPFAPCGTRGATCKIHRKWLAHNKFGVKLSKIK